MSKNRRNRKGNIVNEQASGASAESTTNNFTWKRNVLAHAIAVAGAGIAAPAAACVTAPVTGSTNATCTVGDGESLTVTSTGSIVTSGGDTAVVVEPGGGDITIEADATSQGQVSSSNDDGTTRAIDIQSTYDGTLSNAGIINADAGTTESFGATAYGIDIDDLTGTLNNSGTITSDSTVNNGGAFAFGIGDGFDENGDVQGAIINSGDINATATGSGFR